MKHRGFTLIELLAVIVILAVIALIATPLVLNVIDGARVESVKTSAKSYFNAVETQGVANILQNKKNESSILLVEDLKSMGVQLKGKVPTDGYVKVDENYIVNYTILCVDNKYVVYENNTVTVDDKKTCGDIVKPMLLSKAIDTTKASQESLTIVGGEISSPEENELLVSEDNKGMTYYYRGNVTNNYVSFAGYIWRIVRINGDGSIRLISQDPAIMASFIPSSDYTDRAKAGYTYNLNGQIVDSNAKIELTKWYNENILNKGYDSYIVTSDYCADSTFIDASYNTTTGIRLSNHQTPSFKCDTSTGLHNLKVGLISADEAVAAGALYEKNNSSFYLYNASAWYTMTTFQYVNGRIRILYYSNSN